MTGPDIRSAECQFGENRYNIIWAISPIIAFRISAKIEGIPSSIGSVISNPEFCLQFQVRLSDSIWIFLNSFEPPLTPSSTRLAFSLLCTSVALKVWPQFRLIGVTKEEILSSVQLFVILQTTTYQAPVPWILRQEYQSGLPYPPLGNLPDRDWTHLPLCWR